MKREIKFRTWNPRLKRMAQVREIEWLWNEDTECCDIIDFDAQGALMSDTDMEIMQFTGLIDKNGKEIYEGDIVKDDAPNPLQVSWSNEFASFVLKRNGWMFSHWFGESCDAKDVEVIGNIYENPELL